MQQLRCHRIVWLPWAMLAVFCAGLLVSLYVRKAYPAADQAFAGLPAPR